MKIKHKNRVRKGFTLVELLVVIAIIAGLAAMSYGPIMKQVKAAARTQAINKGKNLFVALTGFAKDNDDLFPNEDTNDDVGGSTAEACFTQLLIAGQVDDEEIFWIKENTALGTVRAAKPDNNGVVDPGENAWGYVRGLTNTSKTSAPLIFDSSSSPGQFDTAVWDGKAIVVKLNGSAEAMDIEFGGGKPTNDDGSSKTGTIEEKRGSTSVDIFSDTALPPNTDVLVPAGS